MGVGPFSFSLLGVCHSILWTGLTIFPTLENYFMSCIIDYCFFLMCPTFFLEKWVISNLINITLLNIVLSHQPPFPFWLFFLYRIITIFGFSTPQLFLTHTPIMISSIIQLQRSLIHCYILNFTSSPDVSHKPQTHKSNCHPAIPLGFLTDVSNSTWNVLHHSLLHLSNCQCSPYFFSNKKPWGPSWCLPHTPHILS